eukprot:3577280-Heterocapsa_arctica.AAC.1
MKADIKDPFRGLDAKLQTALGEITKGKITEARDHHGQASRDGQTPVRASAPLVPLLGVQEGRPQD